MGEDLLYIRSPMGESYYIASFPGEATMGKNFYTTCCIVDFPPSHPSPGKMVYHIFNTSLQQEGMGKMYPVF
jgi:hypothetical protein